MKKKLFSMLALLCLTAVSAWAQQTYTVVTATANANEWTFTMPESDVELEVEYYTDLKDNVAIDYTAFDGATVSGTAKPTEISGVDFIPTLSRTQVSGNVKNILFLGADNTLLNPSAENQYMRGFRAYFQVADGAGANIRSFSLDFGDGETAGIQTLSIDGQPAQQQGIFDLQGRRINGQPTQKGVYIMNGKKLMVK